MIEHRIHPSAPTEYTLYRVYRDGTEELLPEATTTDEATCIERGFRMTREEPTVAFSLYRDGTRRMKFAHDRLVLRLKPASISMLVSS